MKFDFSYFISLFGQLLPFVPVTLLMAVVSMALAIVLGLAITLLELSKIRALRLFAKFYVSLFRGMPTLVQLFIVYYGLPQIFPALRGIPAMLAALVGLGFMKDRLKQGSLLTLKAPNCFSMSYSPKQQLMPCLQLATLLLV